MATSPPTPFRADLLDARQLDEDDHALDRGRRMIYIINGQVNAVHVRGRVPPQGVERLIETASSASFASSSAVRR